MLIMLVLLLQWHAARGTWRRQVLALFTARGSMVKGRGKLLLRPSVKLHCWEMPGISWLPPGPGRLSELPGGTLANCISWSRLMCTEEQRRGSGRLYFCAVVQGKDLTFSSIQWSDTPTGIALVRGDSGLSPSPPPNQLTTQEQALFLCWEYSLWSSQKACDFWSRDSPVVQLLCRVLATRYPFRDKYSVRTSI